MPTSLFTTVRSPVLSGLTEMFKTAKQRKRKRKARRELQPRTPRPPQRMKRGLLRIAPGMNNGSTGTTVPYWLLSPSPATNVAAPAENQNPTEEN